jgi:2-keto-4-pentenoate hydratase/2-oxohepta-3-ene-1,7-dioic acid hydratase in catechol pathway
MRFGRFALAGRHVYARLGSDQAEVLSDAPWLGGRPTGEQVPWSERDLLAPVTPSKVVCIGRNYAAHAKELGHEVPSEPLLFLKAPSAIVGSGEPIRLPPESARVEHEAELGVVIGKRARAVREEDALDHVFGYVPLCDVTARDLQRRDVQFTRAKSFDTFCPIGPFIETELDPRDVRVVGRVNGAVRQDGRTRDMLFPVAFAIAYISRMMTLEPGDVIATGTPEGVGPLVDGDRLEVEIEGVGCLRCDVRTSTR